ncbi:unnamed protein product [Arctia plantaginis]|uniref:Iris-A n=1 Tax=Arctia plantaginis TaxID=874455 RepID=A0A8S1B0J4_ARCPL|nr:unnamed protein product [Arctia plantaginis]
MEIEKDTHLCTMKQPIQKRRSGESLCIKSHLSNQCLSSTLACVDSWNELNTRNTCLYFCCGHCSVRIICGNQITAERLHKPGIITISDECIIKSDSFIIYAHQTPSNTLERGADVIRIQIPLINNILNISIPIATVENQTLHSEHQKYFEEMDEQIKQMKGSASDGVLAEHISYHDVHHYVVIYVMLIAGAIALAVLVWQRRRARSASTPSLEAQPCTETRSAQAACLESQAIRQAPAYQRTGMPDVELPTASNEPFSVRCVSETAVNQCYVSSELNFEENMPRM